MDIITLLGTIAFYGIAVGLVLTLVAGVLLLVFLRWNRTLFPNLAVMLIMAFSSPLKVLFKILRLDQMIVDRTLVELMNKVFYNRFAETAYSERALFLPQCLRNSDCPAKLGANGIECVKCSRTCAVKEAKVEAEKLGYRAFIVPGGGFVKRLVLRHRPKAIVGVACLPEVMLGMDIVSKTRLPGQSVVLLKSGCLNTCIDMDELKAVLATRSE